MSFHVQAYMCVLSYKYKESTHFDFCLVKRVQRITVLRYTSVTPLVLPTKTVPVPQVKAWPCSCHTSMTVSLSGSPRGTLFLLYKACTNDLQCLTYKDSSSSTAYCLALFISYFNDCITQWITKGYTITNKPQILYKILTIVWWKKNP